MIRKPWNKNYICVNSKQTSFNCIQCWSCPELQLCILEVVAVIRVIYPRKGSRVDFWCRKHFMMWRSLYVMEFKYKRQHDFGNAMETLVHKGQGAKWMDCPYNWCDIKSKIQLDVNHYWLEVKADGIMKGEDNYKIKSWCKCCCLYTSSQYVQVENVSCSQSVSGQPSSCELVRTSFTCVHIGNFSSTPELRKTRSFKFHLGTELESS